MTKLRWDRARHVERYSDDAAWRQADRWMKPAKAKPLIILRHTRPALSFAGRDARMTVAARTGMKLANVRLIESATKG